MCAIVGIVGEGKVECEPMGNEQMEERGDRGKGCKI